MSARVFHVELRTAMEYRGMSAAAVGEALGVAGRQVSGWRRGLSLPRHETCLRLADVLMWDGLAAASVAARVRRCETCGVTILSTSTGARWRRYCTPGCQRTGYARSVAKARVENVRTYKRRLSDAHDAIAAFCRRCADGRCPDPKCDLNPVSPFISPAYRRRRTP